MAKEESFWRGREERFLKWKRIDIIGVKEKIGGGKRKRKEKGEGTKRKEREGGRGGEEKERERGRRTEWKRIERFT